MLLYHNRCYCNFQISQLRLSQYSACGRYVFIQTSNSLSLSLSHTHTKPTPLFTKFLKSGHWPNTIAGHYSQYLPFNSTNMANRQLRVVRSQLYVKEQKSGAAHVLRVHPIVKFTKCHSRTYLQCS